MPPISTSSAFVEGTTLPSADVDVDRDRSWLTGNVAYVIRPARATVGLIRELWAEAFRKTPFSRIAALLGLYLLRRLSKGIDPRPA